MHSLGPAAEKVFCGGIRSLSILAFPGGGGMKSLIEAMAKALVDKPESVSVAEVEGERTTVYELRVDTSDLGKVIGKQGKTAKAMRTILGAAGTKIGKRCVLEILE